MARILIGVPPASVQPMGKIQTGIYFFYVHTGFRQPQAGSHAPCGGGCLAYVQQNDGVGMSRTFTASASQASTPSIDRSVCSFDRDSTPNLELRAEGALIRVPCLVVRSALGVR